MAHSRKTNKVSLEVDGTDVFEILSGIIAVQEVSITREFGSCNVVTLTGLAFGDVVYKDVDESIEKVNDDVDDNTGELSCEGLIK